jgi:hypothetical protein
MESEDYVKDKASNSAAIQCLVGPLNEISGSQSSKYNTVPVE